MKPLTMPRWGLSMTEGTVVEWLLDEGQHVAHGDEVVSVETEKILAGVESQQDGVLRRQVAKEGETLPVGALLAILTETDTPECKIDAFVAKFQQDFVPLAEKEVPSNLTRSQSVLVEDRHIHYRKWGHQGNPMILIHGFGGDHNNWLFNQDTLAASSLVYALDLPGHGGSSKDVGTGSIGELTNCVAGFIGALDIGPAHLIGHSMGGLIALRCALENASLVTTLTLIGSCGLGSEINGIYLDGFISSRRHRQLKAEVEKLFADPSLITRQMVEELLKYKRIDGVQNALEKISDQLREGNRQRSNLSHRLTELNKPLLVLWGQNDQIIPSTQARRLPKAIRTEVIANAGHMVQMEAANQVNQLILELARV